ncbi:MAG: tRNA guanosine(34) transglycosylase Tgt [Bacteroidales bacterium]|nr:MAG: tRNA guanosine(34) transglycosylase Tgt [Bacteroidales bacterium]
MKFKILKRDKDTNARVGTITTDHGDISTPIFIPVGTAGTVKAVHQRELENDTRAQIILGNTYHLFLRPGTDVIQKSGGLHKFINWNKPLITDSGGYQIYSLAESRKLKEEGAFFCSHIDGSKHVFTPENTVDIQRKLGADIMMAFDECTPFPCDYEYARKSMELTHRWLKRGIRQFENTESLYGFSQSYLPIVQGSVYKDLRTESSETVTSINAEGYAIGGLSVGEPVDKMYQMVEVVTNTLPVDRLRYLMGVGTPVNLLESISMGVDMFDCVIPTRNGRNGMLFTREGIINIKNLKWKNDFSVLDGNGTSFVDKSYSKAYLRHLVISQEILGAQIATLHNLSFYLWLMEEARKRINEGSFLQWKNTIVKKLSNRL